MQFTRQPLGGGALLPAWLPLTTRLEQAFAARVSELPTATRAVLLVAAMDEAGVLADVAGRAARRPHLSHVTDA